MQGNHPRSFRTVPDLQFHRLGQHKLAGLRARDKNYVSRTGEKLVSDKEEHEKNNSPGSFCMSDAEEKHTAHVYLR